MKYLPVIFASFLLVSCKQNTVQDAVPAVLVGSDEAGRQEIQQHIENVLGGSVLLADGVLTGNSEIVVERRPQRDPSGNRLPGRILTEPERFRLIISRKGECILVHLNSDQHWILEDSRCVPITADPSSSTQYF